MIPNYIDVSNKDNGIRQISVDYFASSDKKNKEASVCISIDTDDNTEEYFITANDAKRLAILINRVIAENE